MADENIVAHPLMVRTWLADAPVSFSLDSTSSALLELLDSNPGGMEVADIAIALGVSQRRAENLIVSLASAGVVGFVYRSQKFLIARGE